MPATALFADLGRERLLSRVVHGAEEVLLVGEVVIERAAGHPRPGDDLLGAGLRLAVAYSVIGIIAGEFILSTEGIGRRVALAGGH